MKSLSEKEIRCWQALKDVLDPEFPVSVVDMGLIYHIRVQGENVHITMTYTSTACACMEWIQQDIERRLKQEPDVRSVEIEVVWDPPWTTAMLSAEAKEKMREWGVSV